MRVAYPSEIPMDSVNDIIHLFRDGIVVEQKALFASAIWNVEGYLLGLTLGNPYVEKKNFNPKDLELLLPCVDTLQELLNADHIHRACADACEVGAIPWAQILQGAVMILQMLQQLGVLKPKTPEPSPNNPVTPTGNTVLKDMVETSKEAVRVADEQNAEVTNTVAE